MTESEKHAAELIQTVATLRKGQALPPAAELDSADVRLVANLLRLAGTLAPDPAFTEELTERLARASESERRRSGASLAASLRGFTTTWRNVINGRKRFAYALGLAAILLVSAVWAVPAVAQLASDFFAPREIEQFPMRGPVELATVPAEAYVDDLDTLEEKAVFAVLTPRYLPPGCSLRKRSYLPEPIGEAHLEYDFVFASGGWLPCLDIAQRTIQEGSASRPFVGEGSAEEITINGQPGFYVNGMWILPEDADFQLKGRPSNHLSGREMERLSEALVWVEGAQQLTFVQDELLIRIDAGPGVSKEELIRIAESLE